jgi:hypothetical protein
MVEVDHEVWGTSEREISARRQGNAVEEVMVRFEAATDMDAPPIVMCLLDGAVEKTTARRWDDGTGARTGGCGRS